MAPLQKRALISLVLGLLMALTLVIVVVVKDIATFDDDLGFRSIVYAIWVGVPLMYLITVNLTLRRPEQMDERDMLIVHRSSRFQFLAIIFSLVGWVIALTEAFRPEGAVPVVYLTLIMISTLIVSTLAQSAGILIGYWKNS